MIQKLGILLGLLVLLQACKSKDEDSAKLDQSLTVEETPSEAHEFVSSIEKAHHKKDFLQKEMVSFDLDLNFGGQDKLDARLYLSTDSKFIRMEKTDGSVLLFDGEKVWLYPADASSQGARFDVFTWSYFFSLPYKLSDPGTQVHFKETPDNKKLVRLSFEPGTGDAPDDWYDLYIYEKTHLLKYAGYIVTYGGTPAEKAAQNAHAIGYENYREIEGIPIAHSWKFFNYTDQVDTTTSIGDATLSNIKFEQLNKSLFSKPENAIEIKL